MSRHKGLFCKREKCENEDFSVADVDIIHGQSLKTELDKKLFKGLYKTNKSKRVAGYEG